MNDDSLRRWHATLILHPEFVWPAVTDGEHMFTWEEEDPEEEAFEGMHGDELSDADSSDEEEDEQPRDEYGPAHTPFVPDDFSTPGEGLTILPCPAKLPHDIQVGAQLAQWFGPPYDAWFIGTVHEVNRRRTKTENVSVRFVSPEDGETRGVFVASAQTYGADKLWVLVSQVPISVGTDTESEDEPMDSSQEQE